MSARLPSEGVLLELACGTLQHACHIAPEHPGIVWQPSDINPDVIAYGTGLERPDNVRVPVYLDALADQWPLEQADVIFAVNLLHVSPPDVPKAVFQGAAQLAVSDVFFYGPFFVQGQRPSSGNVQFDTELRQQNPQWGIRTVDDVQEAAGAAGYRLAESIPMPANNLMLHLTKEH